MNTAYRVAKFEVKPTAEQLAAITTISERLLMLWNMALQAREKAYEAHLAPLYRALAEGWHESSPWPSDPKVRAKAIKAAIKKAKKHQDVADNANAFAQMKHLLTPLRRRDPDHAAVPQAYQQDCLKTLDASFKSYYELKKKGDPKARKPRAKPEGWFQEISCRDCRRVQVADDYATVCIPGGKIADRNLMTFPVPEYQRQQMLGRSVRKFTLYRDRKGRYWMSVAFDMEVPEELPQVPLGREANTVFIALGTTAIAVLAPPLKPHGNWREMIIDVPRADRHWKPRIDAVSARMDQYRRPKDKKPSRKYRRLQAARATMFRLLGEQQKLQQREMAQRLLAMGTHFVVTELVVRAKPGKLADSEDAARGGTQGFNWAVQNTGWIANMVAWLRIKATEKGGRVQTFKVEPPHPRGKFRQRKLAMARLLREQYLASK